METVETWKSTIGSVVRFALGGLVAYLVQKGVVTSSQGEFLITEAIAGVIAAVTLGWAYLKNKKAAAALADANRTLTPRQ